MLNPFVNPNQRGVELPKGCKDLLDVLRAKKCAYCDDVAVPTMGWPADFRWCEACQRDLMEFARIEVPKSKLVDTSDNAAIVRYRAEMQRREEDFMREKVRQRMSRQ